MSNAALYLHPDGYDTTGSRLLGRHSAGESFLRGLLRHADVERFYFWNVAGAPQTKLDALVERIQPPSKPVTWLGKRERGRIGEAGVLNVPGPGLAGEAWLRRPSGQAAYGICSITHTTATHRVMDAVADMMLAPAEPWDSLICTSSAVRQSVELQLDMVRADLRERLGATRFPAPMIETIPLGVNVADFAPSEAHRAAWRQRLGIPEDGIVALYMGRLNALAKMNPALMALALEAAAKGTGQTIYWVVAGWAETPAIEASFHAATRELCPNVVYLPIDGRPPDVRFSIWSVGDFFISFSDNIQETFGLTPVEAMAAGLPCVVSDWDGYKDTVRDAVDGFRIPTIAPAPGSGRDLSYHHAADWIPYGAYVGAAAQVTAIDLHAAAAAIAALVTNPDLRRTMGARAQQQALAVFDWAAIIPRYQALWAEMNRRRLAAPRSAPAAENPRRLDPFTLFRAYPTEVLTPAHLVAAAPDMSWDEALVRLTGGLAAFPQPYLPTIDEAAAVFARLQSGPATVADVVNAFPPVRRGMVGRGLLWMAKFGVLEIARAHT